VSIPDHIDAPRRRPALRPALLAAIVLTSAAAGQASAGVLSATVEGSGTIAAEVTGISGVAMCPPQCEAAIPDGTPVRLTATAAARAGFLGWGGACASAIGNRCDLVVAGDMTLSARFSVAPPPPPEPEPPRDARLEDVTIAGALPACTAPRGGTCSERLAGVLRDGRLLMVRQTFGAGVRSTVRTTLRAVPRTGAGGRVVASLPDAFDTTRLSTDRTAVLVRSERDDVVRGVLVPSGRRVTYRSGVRRGEALNEILDRAAGRLMLVAVREVAFRRQAVERNAILVGPLRGGTRRRVDGGEGDGVGARLSPDGRRVAFVTVRGRIVVAAVGGAGRRTVTPASTGPDDGRWFRGGTAPGGRVDWQVGSLAWSPDGTRIAAVVGLAGAGSRSTPVVTVRADGTDLRPAAVGAAAEGHVDWLPDGGLAFQASLVTDGPQGSVRAIGIVEPSGAVSYLRQPGAGD
jgi:hypothetical protein